MSIRWLNAEGNVLYWQHNTQDGKVKPRLFFPLSLGVHFEHNIFMKRKIGTPKRKLRTLTHRK